MATKFIGNLPSPQGTIANGATVTIDVPVGPRYHAFWLVLSTATNAYSSGQTPTLADLAGEIRVKINGRFQRVYTLTELNLIQGILGDRYYCVKAQITGSQASTTPGMIGYYGIDGNLRRITDNSLLTYGASGGVIAYVPIFLAEPWRKEYASTDSFAWPTSWPNGVKPIFSVQLEIVCGQRLSTIVPRAEYDLQQGLLDKDGRPIIFVSTVERATVPYSGSGELTFSQFPLAGSYQSIYLVLSNTAHTIDKIVVGANDRILRDFTRNEAYALIGSRGGALLPQLDYVLPVIFDYDDMPNSAISMDGVTSFYVKPTLTAAAGGNMTVIYERFGPLL